MLSKTNFKNIKKKKYLKKEMFKIMSSGKWRLFWGRFETKIKIQNWKFFNFFFRDFCVGFKSAPGSPIFHYFCEYSY